MLDGDKFVHAEGFTAKGDTPGEMFHSFRNWWRPFLVCNRVEAVALEEPLPSNRFRNEMVDGHKVKVPFTNMKTLLGLYGVRAHAIEICHALNIPVQEINNQAWRQEIYGRRTAPKGTLNASDWWKQQALDRCKLLGWSVPTKDAAESALIADWLRIQLNPRMLRARDMFKEVA